MESRPPVAKLYREEAFIIKSITHLYIYWSYITNCTVQLAIGFLTTPQVVKPDIGPSFPFLFVRGVKVSDVCAGGYIHKCS